MSAVTIRDMVKVVEYHGLVPIPVDVDPHTLQPTPEDVLKAVSSRTRVLVVAHIYGTVSPLDALAAIARRHGILLIEDCAEALFRAAPFSSTAASPPRSTSRATGTLLVEPGRWFRGSASADVSMFSFGSIKTATALGGATLRFSHQRLDLWRGECLRL